MDAALLVQYKALSAPTLTLPVTLFSTFWLFPSFLLKMNAFTMRYEIICTTEADTSVDSVVLLLVLPLPWLTDASSSQQWVIYSQTNGAVSNYTYLFRFVWFVIVFSDLL